MLEIKANREENSRYTLWDVDFASGYRLGVCKSYIRIYRATKEPDTEKYRKRLLETDVFQEIFRFHIKYGNITIEKMAERLLNESEYLIDEYE